MGGGGIHHFKQNRYTLQQNNNHQQQSNFSFALQITGMTINMDFDLGILLSTFLMTYIAIKLLKPLAGKVGLLDLPDQRKVHVGAVPLVGGLAVFTSVAITSLCFMPLDFQQQVILGGATLILVLGVLDDARELSVRSRLLVQALTTLAMCLLLNTKLAHMGNMLGFGDIELGLLGYLVAMFAVIGAINAFNMMDGIDGLAGSMALVSLLGLATLFGITGAEDDMLWALMFGVALLPYLAANLKLPPFKHKIFMGDAGSMLLGFIIVWLLILGSQQANEPSFRTVTALWLIAIPLMDMAAIMARRIRKGKSPFLPDRDHLHHIFLRAGFSARQALVIIFCVAVLLAGVGILGELYHVPEWLMFGGFLLLFALYCCSLQYIWRIVRFVRRNQQANNILAS